MLALVTFCMIFLTISCKEDKQEPVPEPTELTATDFVSQLKAPLGFTQDSKGQFWVTEAGTGNNDGALVMITAAGVKTTVATGFPSVISMGSIEGLSRPMIKDGIIYVSHGVSGMLYKGDISAFKPGDAALPLTYFQKEDIGTYVRSQNLSSPLNSNVFDQLIGPDGHLYMVDAGANAIIKKDKTSGALSVFARFDNVATGIEAVPTGIVYDGTNFLVSNLAGAPFLAGNARIFQVTPTGTVSVYKTGFTNLTNLVLTKNNKPLVLQLGEFGAGFTDGSGKVLDETGKTLLSGLTMPTDIIRTGDREFYVLSYKFGKIQKLTF